MKKNLMVLCAIGIFLGTCSHAEAQIGNKLKGIFGMDATSSDTVKSAKNVTSQSAGQEVTKLEANSAIKQALGNGLQASIHMLSAKDGYLGDAAVKILMPEQAQKVEKALRAVGMGSLCDQFITSMNRAAETAVNEAGEVFVNSLSQMTINDAYNILLSGQEDAATSYFKTNTTAELSQRFTPVIESAMGENNVADYWTQLTSAYNRLPLSSKVETNLTTYVTQKAIDGLFVKVADQELKIRNNLGGSRSTDLLSKVFGWADKQK